MAVKVDNVYTENLPALRFIGKRCLCDPNEFIARWDEWFRNGWFEQIQKLGVALENKDAYIGATNAKGDCYWIGMLFPPGTSVPDGFEVEEIPASKYAVFKLSGIDNGKLFGEEGIMLVFSEMDKRGMIKSETGMDFELYNKDIVFSEFYIAIL